MKKRSRQETTEKAEGENLDVQVDAKRRSYAEAVIEGALRTERV